MCLTTRSPRGNLSDQIFVRDTVVLHLQGYSNSLLYPPLSLVVVGVSLNVDYNIHGVVYCNIPWNIIIIGIL